MTTIFEVFDVVDLRIAVIGFSDPLSIIRLSGTCRRLRSVLYTASCKRWNIGRWDIDVHLKRFVEDPKLFRGMLGKCRAIVSGSNALQFLDGVCYEDSDMDVFFDDPKCLLEFGDYLRRQESYKLKPSSSQRWMLMRSNSRHYRCHPSEPGYGDFGAGLSVVCFWREFLGREIQLIWSEVGVFETVVGFDSTVVMNFFTWNAAYALFPWLTFYQRRGIKTRIMRTESQTERDKKYIGRGFGMEQKFVSNEQLLQFVEDHDFRRQRALFDRYMWQLPFEVDGVDRPLVVDTVRLDMTFKLEQVDGRHLESYESYRSKRLENLLERIVLVCYEKKTENEVPGRLNSQI